MAEREWWTVSQIAAALGVKEETVRRWLRAGALRGDLAANRIGYRVRRADLDAFVSKRFGASLGELAPGQQSAAA